LLNANGTRWKRVGKEFPKPERRESHHVLSLRRFPALAEQDLEHQPSSYALSFPGDWVVDAHVRCHRLPTDDDLSLQQFADAAAFRLLRLRQLLTVPLGSDDLVLQEFDRETLRAFETGLYAVAVFLHDRVWRARMDRGESSAALTSYEHLLSGLAGLRGAQATRPPSILSEEAMMRPRALLHLANNHIQLGNFAAAKSLFARARELVATPRNRGLREDLELDFLLRETQVTRSRSVAERALAAANEQNALYRQHTARVLLASITLSDDPDASREQYETILAERRNATWLYLAEAWFGLGHLALQERKLEPSYRLLAAAQYVYGFLGLQPMPKATASGGPVIDQPSALPSSWLRTPPFASLSRDRCVELRRAAIIESEIQRQLLFDLADHRLPGRDDGQLAVSVPAPLAV
jgi:hypothetical protein